MIALSYPPSIYQLVEAFHHHIITPIILKGFAHDLTFIPYKLLILQGIAHQALVVYILLHFRDNGVLHPETLCTELDLTDAQLDQHLSDLIACGLTQQTMVTKAYYSTDLTAPVALARSRRYYRLKD